LQESLAGIVSRAMKEGRTVDVSFWAFAHNSSPNNFHAAMAKYAGDPRIKFRIMDNTKGAGKAVEVAPEKINEFFNKFMGKRAKDTKAMEQLMHKGEKYILKQYKRGLIPEEIAKSMLVATKEDLEAMLNANAFTSFRQYINKPGSTLDKVAASLEKDTVKLTNALDSLHPDRLLPLLQEKSGKLGYEFAKMIRENKPIRDITAFLEKKLGGSALHKAFERVGVVKSALVQEIGSAKSVIGERLTNFQRMASELRDSAVMCASGAGGGVCKLAKAAKRIAAEADAAIARGAQLAEQVASKERLALVAKESLTKLVPPGVAEEIARLQTLKYSPKNIFRALNQQGVKLSEAATAAVTRATESFAIAERAAANFAATTRTRIICYLECHWCEEAHGVLFHL